MLFSLSTLQTAEVAKENAILRITRLIAEAVRAGQIDSERALMQAAGLSPNYLSERRNALEKALVANKVKLPSVGSEKARAIAAKLGTTIDELLGEGQGDEPPLVDVYPNRAWAVWAARALQLPEAAIRAVLRQDPGADLLRKAWFRRIEAEAENLASSDD